MLLKDRVELWRDRFYGRQEVFGTKISYVSNSTKKMTTHYVAMFSDRFKTKESRKGRNSSNTTVQEYYIPLEDSHVEGHLKGYMELLIYVLQMDGTCKFAALDFDQGHTFYDVLACYDMISKAHKIPCYVARSTSKGHHLYLFFEEPIKAKYLTSYVEHVYEELGFMAMHVSGSKHIPETFPKTIALKGNLSTGYGIKPPMQGKGIENNMNCWVKAEEHLDEPVGGSGSSDEQWEFFSKTKKIKSADFKRMLKDKKIEVREIRLSEKLGAVPQRDYKRTAPYKAPKDGDINRVIAGCPAMTRFWNGTEKDFKNNARVALLTWAMQTNNGLALLRERWKGSLESEAAIEYAIENFQHPWSCAAMQGHELCIKDRDPKFKGGSTDTLGNEVTDHCFKKAVPKETINGKLVINPRNIPESDWKDPCPLRLRNPLKKVLAKDLMKEIDAFSKDDSDLGNKITEMYDKILLLNSKKKKYEVETYLKGKKLAKVSELKVIALEAKENKILDTKRLQECSGSSDVLNGVRYSINRQTGGYSIIDVDQDGIEIEKDISNFQIDLTHDIHIHSLVKDDVHTFLGNIIVGGRRLKFQIETADWGSNLKLSQAINIYGKTEAVVPAYNLDHFRAAVHLFGRYNLKSEQRYEDYGYDSYEDTRIYRSTKWNIGSNGFSDEDDAYVDLSDAGYAKHLGIEKISNDDFARTISVIKKDLLSFQATKMTYTTIAHTLMAAVQQAFLPLLEAPVLWIQGLTGCGKSSLAKFAQDFHGSFPRLISVGGTPKAIEYYSMLFKDALLVLDDYKEAFYRTGTIKLVQSTYDRSARPRLKQNLDQAQAPYCRGLMMVTSEDAPSSEASVLSRCIYIEADKINTTDEEGAAQAFRRVTEARKYFSGVTGRFIHYLLSTYEDKNIIHKKYYDIFDVLLKPIRNQQNGPRAAQNLAANYIVWELFCDFLRDNLLITADEHADMLEIHWQNVIELRDDIIDACFQEQASMVFLTALREAVQSGRLRIDGMNNNVNDNAPTVGFVSDPRDYLVYIYPNIAVSEVKKMMHARGAPISHSQDAIGKQLKQDGILRSLEEGRLKIRKSYRGSRTYVWSLDSVKCCIGPQKEEKSTQPDPDDNVLSIGDLGKI